MYFQVHTGRMPLVRQEADAPDKPAVFSDEEIYRYLPAVLVCTVDKLAHVARAAEEMGVDRSHLYRRMRTLGIQVRGERGP